MDARFEERSFPGLIHKLSAIDEAMREKIQKSIFKGVMKNETIIFNGMKVTADWPEKVEAAQLSTHYEIAGKMVERVRYGQEKEDWGADQRPCHDCAVVRGQLHVPGCDVERCPNCDGQVIGCDCEYEEAEE